MENKENYVKEMKQHKTGKICSFRRRTIKLQEVSLFFFESIKKQQIIIIRHHHHDTSTKKRKKKFFCFFLRL